MSMSLWGLWSTSARVSRIGHSGRLVLAVAGSGAVFQRPRHLSALAGLALTLLDVPQRNSLYIHTGARAIAPHVDAFSDLLPSKLKVARPASNNTPKHVFFALPRSDI